MTTPLRNAVFDAIGGALLDDRREKTLACRVLMRLCVIDGALYPNERAVLDATMARHGLGSDEQRRIGAEMAALLGQPADPDAVADAQVPVETLVASLPKPALAELWIHLEHGAWADGVLVPAESWLLDLVRRHLQHD